MANELSEQPTGRMNRRQMLGTTTALLGGAIAGAGGHAFAQAAPAAAAAGSPT
jgi:nitrous oxide reductase